MKTKNEKIEGFNPRIYRVLGSIFAVLYLINIAAVTFAFNSSGFGLYHAEEAISHIAQIQQYLQSANESVLNIVIHEENASVLKSETQKISSTFQELNLEALEFRKIDSASIDDSLKMEFESAMSEVTTYRTALNDYFAVIENSDGSTNIEYYYTSQIEPLKNNANTAMDNVVKHQKESAYAFFVKTARYFLVLFIFMFVIMAIGLGSIKYMEKNAHKTAKQLQLKQQDALESAQEASHLRRKANTIAYTNILTGLKNRYALEEELPKIMKLEDVTVGVFNFDDFSNLNADYGRNFGDLFLITVADSLKENFSELFEIYHTNADEFCLVQKQTANPELMTDAFLQAVQLLSDTFTVSKIQVQQSISGCIYHYHTSERLDLNALFIKIDRAVKEAKQNADHKIIEIN